VSKATLRNCWEVQRPLACNRSGYENELRNRTTLLNCTLCQREGWPFFLSAMQIKTWGTDCGPSPYLGLHCINPSGTGPTRLGLYTGLVRHHFFIFTKRSAWGFHIVLLLPWHASDVSSVISSCVLFMTSKCLFGGFNVWGQWMMYVCDRCFRGRVVWRSSYTVQHRSLYMLKTHPSLKKSITELSWAITIGITPSHPS